MELMEKILSRENMLSALKAVKRNKGAAGIDEVTAGFLNELNFYEQNFNKSHKYQQYFYSGIITRKYIADFNSL